MDWLFQCNPRRYDLQDAIKRGNDNNWAMNQHRDLVSPGDKVFFWETGPDACLRAVGSVTSPVYERGDGSFGRYAVDIRYESVVSPALTRQEIQQDPVLGTFKPFSWAMGTNIPIRESTIVAAVEEAIRSRLSPVRIAPGPPEASNYQKDLDTAIKRAEKETLQELMRQVAEMDPTAFEWLIRALLLKLGYTNVDVTKRSGDGGIDVTAKLVAGGIANINTAIQAKRTKSVGRPVIQALRGSLHAHQTGLVITSGRFAENALEDAADPGKAAIACIDGQKLALLLLEHRIGVERRTASIYSLTAEDLTLDSLQNIVELGSSEDAS
jgi:restriction endonuclease Mrr